MIGDFASSQDYPCMMQAKSKTNRSTTNRFVNNYEIVEYEMPKQPSPILQSNYNGKFASYFLLVIFIPIQYFIINVFNGFIRLYKVLD